MRVFAFLLLGVAALSAGGAGQMPAATSTVHRDATAVPADDSHFGYMGRVAMVEGVARMAFPGIVVRFVYRGPAPALRLKADSPDCYFELSCNHWDPVVIHLAPGENVVPLPTGEAPREGWEIELVRRTEAWQGTVDFEGVSLPPGCRLLPPPAWPERRLMFIGDSITCGEYLERFPPENDPTPRTTNAARSFGMLLGRWLHAQVHLVSYGGRGVMRDWQGRTDVANAPQFFERTLPDDPDSHWNHADYVPDAIVICLGTNDFGPGFPDEAEFGQAYARFVAQVRRAYPAAGLLLAESPIFGETPGTPDRKKRDQLRRTLEAVVAGRHAAGDRNIAVAPLHAYPGTAGNAHPVAFQHEQIALELLGPIRAITGWQKQDPK